MKNNFNYYYYFFTQGVMVRLMLVLAPVACILAGIGISSVLTTYMKVCFDSSGHISALFSSEALSKHLALKKERKKEKWKK